MSVCMGQGQKPILSVCVLWTVNIKNRPSFIVGIWNFRKTMWANPVFRWHFKCKFKFYQARKELEKDSESHLLCLSPSSFKMDWDQVENCPVDKLKTTEKGKATICNGLVSPYCTYCEGSINAKQHLKIMEQCLLTFASFSEKFFNILARQWRCIITCPYRKSPGAKFQFRHVTWWKR